MIEHILLTDDQKQLLVALVEAARSVPKDKRRKFSFQHNSETFILHWSIPGWSFDCYKGDVEILALRNLILPSYDENGIYAFDITPEGFQYYEEFKQQTAEPTKRVEQSIQEYLSSLDFQKRHPKAFLKWKAAEQLLWTTDSDQQLSTVGHLCREASQEFTDSLVTRFMPPDANDQKALTKNRLKAVLKSQSTTIPKTVLPYVESLILCWDTLMDLVQRQEHAAERDKESLVWEDARRLVFHTGVLMFEVDRLLTLYPRRTSAASGS